MKKRILSLLLCVVLLFSATGTLQAFAATKQELQEKIVKIDAQIKANREKINDLKSKKEKQQEYLDALQNQITAQQEKINAVQQQIDAVSKEIRKLNKKIDKIQKQINKIRDQIRKVRAAIEKTRAQIEAQKDELSAKLRASYISGKESNLKLLMGASSLASFLTRLEMMRRTSKNDKAAIEAFRDIVDRLKKQKAELAEKKSIFDEKKEEVKAVRDQKQERKNELNQKKATLKKALAGLQKSYNQINALIGQLDATSSVYQSYINRLQSERRQADAEIDAIIRKAEEERLAKLRAQQQQQGGGSSGSGGSSGASGSSGGSAPASSGSWGYPVGGSTYISSGYGNRSASISGWSFHGGIDIAGGNIYGRPIYASRGGTVITATYGTTGYGNYVIIDHGDGYTSVYGHCSSLSVSTGQSVSKGQHIANVGSSGNSTGPHCHFEVRYNGVKQNPMNYL